MGEIKALPEHAVYSDVVDRGLILPRKEKYTKTDFKKLVKKGWREKDARWIIICSAVYHDTEYSKIFHSEDFILSCKLGLAHL